MRVARTCATEEEVDVTPLPCGLCGELNATDAQECEECGGNPAAADVECAVCDGTGEVAFAVEIATRYGTCSSPWDEEPSACPACEGRCLVEAPYRDLRVSRRAA